MLLATDDIVKVEGWDVVDKGKLYKFLSIGDSLFVVVFFPLVVLIKNLPGIRCICLLLFSLKKACICFIQLHDY